MFDPNSAYTKWAEGKSDEILEDMVEWFSEETIATLIVEQLNHSEHPYLKQIKTKIMENLTERFHDAKMNLT